MTESLRYLRLMLSGAILGIAIAGLMGFDTSVLGNASIASICGAGSALALIKGLAVI